MGGKVGKDSPKNFEELVNESKHTTVEVKRWYQSFSKRYPQGHISRKDFDTIYATTYPHGDSSLMGQQVFRVFDKNQDGKIDFREMVIGLGLGSRGSVDEKMDLMFSLYDINGDGVVTKAEMRNIVTSMLLMSQPSSRDARLSRQSFSMRSIEERTNEHVEEVFGSLDISGDGLVSRDEFMALGEDSLIMEVFSPKC